MTHTWWTLYPNQVSFWWHKQFLRNWNCQFFVTTDSVTSTEIGHQQWYRCIELNVGHNHTKFDWVQYYCLQQKPKVKVSDTAGHRSLSTFMNASQKCSQFMHQFTSFHFSFFSSLSPPLLPFLLLSPPPFLLLSPPPFLQLSDCNNPIFVHLLLDAQLALSDHITAGMRDSLHIQPSQNNWGLHPTSGSNQWPPVSLAFWSSVLTQPTMWSTRQPYIGWLKSFCYSPVPCSFIVWQQQQTTKGPIMLLLSQH